MHQQGFKKLGFVLVLLFKARWRGLIATLLFTAVLFLAGCGDDGSDRGENTVMGNASLVYPVSGASVSFYRLDGVEIPGAATYTSSLGNFASSPDYFPPEGFRIIVEGGTLDGEPFAGQLTATVADEAEIFQKVNFLTTLASRYVERSGDSHLESLQELRRYFQIPDYIPVEFLIRHGDVHRTILDERLFYAGIQDQGFGDYLDQTLDEMLARETAPAPFLQVSAPVHSAEKETGSGSSSVSFGTIFSTTTRFLNGLYKGSQADLADKYDGGDRAGWMLKMLASGGDMTGAELSYAVQKLDVIDDKLTHLTTAFSEFRKQVAASFDKLELKLQRAEDRLVAVEEETSIAPDIDYIYNNTFGGKFLDKWRQMFDPADNTLEKIDDDDLTSDCASLLDFNFGILTHLDNIHDALINPTGTGDSSILEALATSVIDQTKGHKDASTIENAYQAFAAKYKLYVYWQICGINLYVEAWHHNKTQPGDGKELALTLDKLRSNLAAQANHFLTQTYRIIANSNYATIQGELTGSGDQKILSQAYLLASRITDQDHLKGSLIGLVAGTSADTLSELYFSGPTDLSASRAERVYDEVDLGGNPLPYMIWGRSADGTATTLDTGMDYALQVFRMEGIDKPGSFTESVTGTSAEVIFYDGTGETEEGKRPNAMTARDLNLGPWGTFKRVSDNGQTYLKVKDQDLWLCLGPNGELVYFGEEAERTELTFPQQSEAENDPAVQEVTVRLGSAYLQVSEGQTVIGRDDPAEATTLELVQINRTDDPDEVALRHKGQDDHGNTLHYYLHPQGGILQGIWVRSLIAENEGYEKKLFDDPDYAWDKAGTSKNHPYMDNFKPSFTEDLVGAEVYTGFTGKTHSSNYVLWHNFHAQAKTTNKIRHVLETGDSDVPIPLAMSTESKWAYQIQSIDRQGWGVPFWPVAWASFTMGLHAEDQSDSLWSHSGHDGGWHYDHMSFTWLHKFDDDDFPALKANGTYYLTAEVNAVAGKNLKGDCYTKNTDDSRQDVNIWSKLTMQTTVRITIPAE